MKILWITHDPIRTGLETNQSTSGFWKEALLDVLKKNTDFEIIVATPGIQKNKINEFFYTFHYTHPKKFKNLPEKTYADLLWIINSCKPDLIHVHGTELPYGLIKSKTHIPVVISLQGFISESFQFVLGEIAIKTWKRNSTLKEHLLQNSFINMYEQWRYNAECEKKVIRENTYFLGRTAFDKNVVLKNNPKAIYFEANELLREDFYKATWNFSDIQRYSIYTSSFSNPLKGFHILLEAAALLKNEFPEIVINVPGGLSKKTKSFFTGNAYSRMLCRMITKYNLSKNINFLGKLSGTSVASTLQKTHVFVLPSLIENSSNALGEAQLTGVPCIATNTGGTSSIIQDYKNGLLTKAADATELAKKIKEVFLNNELALKLSFEAKTAGSSFHNKTKIISQYSAAYKKITAHESSL